MDDKATPPARPGIAELQAFLAEAFPHDANPPVVEALGPGTARLRLPFHPGHLRPGGTLSGPAMMALTDRALYVAILHRIGLEPMTVTTSLTINFLRKPRADDLIADARILRLGRLLVVGEVTLSSPGEADPVAHATLTYAIPQAR